MDTDWTFKKIPFEEVKDLPEFVYKYREWDNVYHKTILTDQIVFFARPTSFPDPLDCKLQKRYDLMTDKDIFEMYMQKSREINPDWNRQRHREFAKEWLKKSPLHDKMYVKKMQEETFYDFDSKFGVLSLTEHPDNFQMWTQYSNHHHGFCVGFNFRKVYNFFGGGVPVQYPDNLPIINWDDPFELEFFKQVGFKENKWEFEDEYRVHKYNPNLVDEDNRKIKIPCECYSHVVFGAKMPESHKDEIVEVCKKNGLRVTYFIETIINGTEDVILKELHV